MDWIVFDLDGTLANCDHRVHLAQAKLWDEFHSHLHLDTVHERARTIYTLFEHDIHDLNIAIVTGRPERYRQSTTDWLLRHSLLSDTLLMRPLNDWRPDAELKLELLAQFFGSFDIARERVLLVVEDRDRMVEAYRNAGFECWQCRAGAY